MNRTTTELQGGIQRRQTQLIKLSKLSSLSPDEKQEILEASDEDFLDSLVAIQRDQLAVQVLQKMLLTSTQEVTASLCKFDIGPSVKATSFVGIHVDLC